MKIFKIRPHHILCINNFIGEGYSREFSKNMAEIKNHLESDASAQVMIICSCDDICNLCPHRIGFKCDTENKVNIFDKNALRVLKISEGKQYSWKDLCYKFNKEIVQNKRLNEVCSECSWLNICENILK